MENWQGVCAKKMKKPEKSGGIRQFPDTGARDLPFFFKKSEKRLTNAVQRAIIFS